MKVGRSCSGAGLGLYVFNDGLFRRELAAEQGVVRVKAPFIVGSIML